MSSDTDGDGARPSAFICHASEDRELAERLAKDFEASGVSTFYSDWEIGAGDSIRERIDEGLGNCTHFVALLTPQSIEKPWVRAEMDSAFVKRVDGECRFLPVRVGLAVSEIPELLRGLNSPELSDYDTAAPQLIRDILGMTRKPESFPEPTVIDLGDSFLVGFSPAACAIVRIMAERSEHAMWGDPTIEVAELKEALGLHEDEIQLAVDELEGRGLVEAKRLMGHAPLGYGEIRALPDLFAEADGGLMGWSPAEDSYRVLAELVSERSSGLRLAKLSERLGWPPRRLNPAVTHLLSLGLAEQSEECGSYPFCCTWMRLTTAGRRALHDRE